MPVASASSAARRLPASDTTVMPADFAGAATPDRRAEAERENADSLLDCSRQPLLGGFVAVGHGLLRIQAKRQK
jgi:hypothetical protein